MNLSTIVSVAVLGVAISQPSTVARDWYVLTGKHHEARADDGDTSIVPMYIHQQESDITTGIESFAGEQGTVADRLTVALNEIASYANLGEDWDGEGAVAVSQEHMDAASSFLQKIPGGIAIPAPMVETSGAVGLYWDLPNAYADITFEGGDMFSLFTKKKGTGVETYFPAEHIADIDGTWFSEKLAVLKYS